MTVRDASLGVQLGKIKDSHSGGFTARARGGGNRD